MAGSGGAFNPSTCRTARATYRNQNKQIKWNNMSTFKHDWASVMDQVRAGCTGPDLDQLEYPLTEDICSCDFMYEDGNTFVANCHIRISLRSQGSQRLTLDVQVFVCGVLEGTVATSHIFLCLSFQGQKTGTAIHHLPHSRAIRQMNATEWI